MIEYPAALREKRGIDFIKNQKYKEAHNNLKAALKTRPSPLAIKNLLQLCIQEQKTNHSINYFNLLNHFYPSIINHDWAKNCKKQIQELLKSKHKNIEPPITKNTAVKIATISAIWQRPQLTEIFIQHLERMFEKTIMRNFDHRAFLSVSENRWLNKDAAIAHPCCNFIETENFPLSLKWQAALNEARKWKPDIIFIMGSDNFISDQLFLKLADPILTQGIHFSGLKDCAMIDNAKVIKWLGYNPLNQPHRTGEPIGAGRLISSQLLEHVNWNLWGGAKINKGLDSLVMGQLEDLGYTYADTALILSTETASNKLLSLQTTKYTDTVIDVKTSVNVTKTNETVASNNFESCTASLSQFLNEATGDKTTASELNTYINHSKE